MSVLGMPLEFVFFALTLICVAVFHTRALTVALVGLATTVVYKVIFTGFAHGSGLEGLVSHLGHEWVILTNLMLLLVGFAVLAHHFEESKLPHVMPKFLPDNWTGGLALLAMVFCLSAVLDNIAGAVIGGVIAKHVYRGNVSLGFVASLVAASNAGGAGSVIGDTTTTMLWLAGVSPISLLPAFVGSIAAFSVFGLFGALAQQRHAPIMKHTLTELRVDWIRLAVVAGMLFAIVGTNVVANAYFPGLEEVVPLLGIALWVAILLALFARQPDWDIAPEAAKGALFLIALVALASLMPVEALPKPTWITTLGLGFISAVFDNIPLTALAIQQNGYDWAVLAYAVGFGGSMVWFGSSAGVAITGLFPEGRSVAKWLRAGWHVPLAFLFGFLVMLLVHGWTPHTIGQG